MVAGGAAVGRRYPRSRFWSHYETLTIQCAWRQNRARFAYTNRLADKFQKAANERVARTIFDMGRGRFGVQYNRPAAPSRAQGGVASPSSEDVEMIPETQSEVDEVPDTYGSL